MKKMAAILLAITMMAGFTACGSFAESVKEGVGEGIDSAVEEVAQEVNSEVTRGVIDGNVYTSDFSGITFTKPDNWSYYTDEQLAELVNIGVEQLEADNLTKALTEVASVYDMCASDVTGSSVMVCYENTDMTLTKGKTPEEYMELLQKQLKEMQSTLDYTFGEIETVTLGGEEYTKLTAYASTGGVEMTQYYYSRYVGKYMASIIITDTVGTQVEDIEAMFS